MHDRNERLGHSPYKEPRTCTSKRLAELKRWKKLARGPRQHFSATNLAQQIRISSRKWPFVRAPFASSDITTMRRRNRLLLNLSITRHHFQSHHSLFSPSLSSLSFSLFLPEIIDGRFFFSLGRRNPRVYDCYWSTVLFLARVHVCMCVHAWPNWHATRHYNVGTTERIYRRRTLMNLYGMMSWTCIPSGDWLNPVALNHWRGSFVATELFVQPCRRTFSLSRALTGSSNKLRKVRRKIYFSSRRTAEKL